MTAELEAEEAILRNTFVNAQSGPIQPQPPPENAGRNTLLKWTDQSKGEKLAAVGPPVQFGPGTKKRDLNHRKVAASSLRSCIKKGTAKEDGPIKRL